jgi:hypothetical protein
MQGQGLHTQDLRARERGILPRNTRKILCSTTHQLRRSSVPNTCAFELLYERESHAPRWLRLVLVMFTFGLIVSLNLIAEEALLIKLEDSSICPPISVASFRGDSRRHRFPFFPHGYAFGIPLSREEDDIFSLGCSETDVHRFTSTPI